MREPEVLIVGAGPAGLTAGIYSARFGHTTLLLEKALPGGQVTNTSEVENYPGFAEPVPAWELAQYMEKQAKRFGCELQQLEATGFKISSEGFSVTTTGPIFRPGALIIATGVQPRELGVEGEKRLRGRGVSYCAICDGPLFRNKEVAVVGGGDSALDEAYYLSTICSKVYLIHRRDQFRACIHSQQRLRSRNNVEFVLSSVVRTLKGNSYLEAIEVENVISGYRTELHVSGLFIYIGSVPNTDWCADAVPLDENGFVRTDIELRTAVPGVFAAGDVRVTPLRQIATAVGDGALAAKSAHDYLTRN